MSSRRMSRSRRAVAATVLLATAVAVAVVGVVVATVPVLIGATVYAAVAGVVSARLLSDELAQLRRDWARDRAEQADGFRLTSVARSQENAEFADQMAQRIRLRDVQIETMRDALVTAEIDLALARERFSEERARSEALQADAASAQSDLESARVDLRRASDALAASESAELQARAELLAWEETATEEAKRQQERRLA